MYRFLIILFLTVTLIGCKENATQEIENAISESNVTDTIVNEYDFPDVYLTFKEKDTLLFIDNEAFHLKFTVEIDTLKHLLKTESYLYEGKNYKQKYKGYNATLTIMLIDKSDDTIFNTILTKNDFEDILDGEALTRSEIYLPVLLDYLETFESFAFSLNFMIPDSDVGAKCLLLINRKGELIENTLNNLFGVGDCSSVIEIPSHQKFILTCQKIINADGTHVELSDKNAWQVGTKLINDNTILAVQEFNDSTQMPNAKLIDNYGNTLKQFIYKGYYNTLDFVVPIHFDPHSQNYFLLDEKMKQAVVINKNQPLSLYAVDFAKMNPFNDDKNAGELVFEMELEYTHYTFAFDTLKNTFRKRKD